VEAATAEGERLRVTVHDAEATVARLVAALAAAGAPILEVAIESPTLEAAYLACIRESA
jgi:hypothetical protein